MNNDPIDHLSRLSFLSILSIYLQEEYNIYRNAFGLMVCEV